MNRRRRHFNVIMKSANFGTHIYFVPENKASNKREALAYGKQRAGFIPDDAKFSVKAVYEEQEEIEM